MIEVNYFPLGGGQRRFSKRERVLKTHRVFIFPKTWFPYSCICRICRVKLAPCSANTTRCNSYDSFKSILGFHIVSCICRIGRTKCILGHIFVVSIVWVTCDKYNYMETRFKRYSIIIKIIKIQSCCFKSIEKFPATTKLCLVWDKKIISYFFLIISNIYVNPNIIHTSDGDGSGDKAQNSI